MVTLQFCSFVSASYLYVTVMPLLAKPQSQALILTQWHSFCLTQHVQNHYVLYITCLP